MAAKKIAKRKAHGKKRSCATLLVRDRMTVGLERIHAVVRLQDAARKMRDAEVGLLAVYDGAELLGVLTDRDLVVRVVAEGLNPVQTPVSAALSPEVHTCREDDRLADALEQMRRRSVRRLVVLGGDDEPCGLVSVDDAAAVEGAHDAVAAVIARRSGADEGS